MIAPLLTGALLGFLYINRLWFKKKPNPAIIRLTGNPLLMGDITNLKISRPNYDNPRRKGTRLSFDLNITNLGDMETMIESATATVVFRKNDPQWKPGKFSLVDQVQFKEETRDIYRGIDPEHMYKLGEWVTVSLLVYFDDLPDDTCIADNLKVHLTDTQHRIHTFALRA